MLNMSYITQTAMNVV